MRRAASRTPQVANRNALQLPIFQHPSSCPEPHLTRPADFHWLPTEEMLGSSAPEIAVRLLAVLPVISLSFICQ